MALTTNKNFLALSGFRFVLQRAPNIEYFSQEAAVPGMSMPEVIQDTPLVVIPRPGDKIEYEPLTINFMVDEDMSNYLEIHNWIVGLGHPYSLTQYNTLDDSAAGTVSDATLIVLNSAKAAKVQVFFEDLFPVNLGEISFNTTSGENEVAKCQATFRYKKFNLEVLA